MKDNTYNGYTNYATWKVQVELLDGISLFELAVLDHNDVHQVADNLKDYCEERVWQDYAEGRVVHSSRSSITHNFASAFLYDVDWRQLASNLIDAYATN